MKKLLIILILFPNLCFALNQIQKDNIVKSYNISKQFGYQHIIPVLCGIESSFGMYKTGDDGKSLGITQIQISTASWLLKKYKITMSEKNLKYLLLNDDEFCIILSCQYLQWLTKQLKGDKQKIILAYNRGLTSVKNDGLKVDPNNYLTKFKKYSNIVNGVLNEERI